jgi:hypothetical protein
MARDHREANVVTFRQPGRGRRPYSDNVERQATVGSSGKHTAPIELTIEEPRRLFHSLDPSPLPGRDLDEKVEHYIVECANERPSPSYQMLLHLSGPVLAEREAQELADAIRSNFACRRDEEERKLRRLVQEGRQALAVGVAFLFVCGLLGLLALNGLPAPLGSFINEGMLIIGWVANWKPVEIFLYDLRPLRRQRDTMGALAHMAIKIRAVG